MTRPIDYGSPVPSKCRGCGAPVRFVSTANGKTMPLDHAPVPDSEPVDDGHDYIIVRDDWPAENGPYAGAARAQYFLVKYSRSRDEQRTRYRSHFRTCEQANQFSGRSRR